MKPSSRAHWSEHVGSRVVVRRRDSAGLHDVLGELLSVDDRTLQVKSAEGPVLIDLSTVVAGKPVPPKASRPAPPHLAPSVDGLERAMAKHWQSAETAPLGDWLLRASGGFTHRANSVLVVGDPGMPTDEALRAVRDWYCARESRPVAAVPSSTVDAREDSVSRITEAGWHLIPGSITAVLTAATGELRGLSYERPLPDGLSLVLQDEPDAAWIEQYRYRGQAVPEHGIRLLTSAPRQAFLSVRTPDGQTVAVVRASLAESWTGLTALEVVPAWQRRGLGTALVGAVAEWGWRNGSRSLFLQVAETNERALALYATAGFTQHHRYRYLTP